MPPPRRRTSPGATADLVGSPGATVDPWWASLDRAAAAFTRSLAAGLHTVLGEQGLRLSGGERKRVAIARPLIREALLLGLDEAKSALGEGAESQVLERMASLVLCVTVQMIAQRHSTIEAAHHIVRLAGGRGLGTA